MFKNFFLFFSLGLWLGASYICNYLFPTTSVEDINGYWDLKKIIHSICIFLVILSAEYNTKLKKLIALVFIGILAEDISDRIQGITYFQYSDWIVLDLIIITSIYSLYNKEIKKFLTSCYQR